MCLAALYGWDLRDEDARHLVFLIASGAALEKFGVGPATRLASKAGVKLLREYLRAGALQVVKQFFRKFGVVFTRAALEKALPFGIGFAAGVGFNFAVTKRVGETALQWFAIDAKERKQNC